jgi:hypothetical protein
MSFILRLISASSKPISRSADCPARAVLAAIYVSPPAGMCLGLGSGNTLANGLANLPGRLTRTTSSFRAVMVKNGLRALTGVNQKLTAGHASFLAASAFVKRH